MYHEIGFLEPSAFPVYFHVCLFVCSFVFLTSVLYPDGSVAALEVIVLHKCIT